MPALLLLISVPDPALDPEGFVAFAAEAWRAGGWVAVVGLVVMTLVAVLRLVGERFWPWLSTRNGKLALATATGAATGLLTGIAMGSVAKGIGLAVATIVASAGAFSLTKNAAQPNNEPTKGA